MKTLFRITLLTVVLACPAWAADAQPLDYKEVYDLLRNNLMGVTDTELNQAAAQGLLGQLQPKVWLVTNETQTAAGTGAVLRTAVYDKSFGYIRIGQFLDGTAQQLSTAYQTLAASNRLKGLVLDLRFANGYDYKAAAAAADLFFSTEKPLMDYGDGLKESTVKTDAISLPVALLVNHKTAGAAEAFVGILRQADIGVVIGSPTAGQAVLSKEFTLKTGQHLHVASAPIKVGKDKPLSLTGIKPEISIEVSPQDELAYMEDPYKELAKPTRLAKAGPSGLSTPANVPNDLSKATNRMPHRRLNEAELVRMLREGETLDGESNTLANGLESTRPTLQDPALLRALDLLKGVAVLNQARRL
jgi:hypothetical protein